MIETLLLYGSKARGDGGHASDTDLLGMTTDDRVGKPFITTTTTLHLYPKAWLFEQAASGSLFLMHITLEAIPLYDPNEHLPCLRESFRYKPSYADDIIVGARIVSAVINAPEEWFSEKLRSRYFWGLRTMLMAYAADKREPTFSAGDLESYSGVIGLSAHISRRQEASLDVCRRFGVSTMRALNIDPDIYSSDNNTSNLLVLLDAGGLSASTARTIIYSG